MIATASRVFGLASILANPKEIKRLTIPTDKAFPPDDEMIDFFNQISLRGDFEPQTFEEKKFIFLTCVRPWLIQLHWLYKKSYDQSHKIPATRAASRFYECHADVLVCLRNICKELHARYGTKTGYSDAGTWFCWAVSDQILLDAQLQLEQFRIGTRSAATKSNIAVPGMQVGKPINKKIAIKMKRLHWLGQLRAGESPFTAENPKFCPHWAKAINMALMDADPNATRTEKGNVFRRTYWRPYLAAESAKLTALDKDPLACRHWYEDGKIYTQKGKGKGKTAVVQIY